MLVDAHQESHGEPDPHREPTTADRFALAKALIDPDDKCMMLGPDKNPMLSTTGKPLRYPLDRAVAQARAGYTPMARPASDVIAIDFDKPDDEVAVANLAMVLEVMRRDYTPLVIASGRPGHKHVWCVVESTADFERLTMLAKSLGLDTRTNQPMRLPLAPHSFGHDVYLITPSGIESALRAVRRSGPVPSRTRPRVVAEQASPRHRELPASYVELLRTGSGALAPLKEDGEVDRSRVEWKLAVTAVNAGWSRDEWVAAITDPLNVGGQKTQRRRDSREYAAKRYDKAMGWVAENPAVASREEVDAGIAAWLMAVEARDWGRTRTSTLAVAKALAEIASDACRLDPTASYRQIMVRAGVNGFKTVTLALKRLKQEPRLLRVAGATSDDPMAGPTTRWALVCPPADVHKGVHYLSCVVLRTNALLCASLSDTAGHDVWRGRLALPGRPEAHGLGRHTWRTACAMDLDIGRSVAAIAALTGFQRRTINTHLSRLSSVGMATQTDKGWLLVSRDLDEVAVELGVNGAQAHLRQVHDNQRAGYRQFLEARTRAGQVKASKDPPIWVDNATGEVLTADQAERQPIRLPSQRDGPIEPIPLDRDRRSTANPGASQHG